MKRRAWCVMWLCCGLAGWIASGCAPGRHSAHRLPVLFAPKEKPKSRPKSRAASGAVVDKAHQPPRGASYSSPPGRRPAPRPAPATPSKPASKPASKLRVMTFVNFGGDIGKVTAAGVLPAAGSDHFSVSAALARR